MLFAAFNSDFTWNPLDGHVTIVKPLYYGIHPHLLIWYSRALSCSLVYFVCNKSEMSFKFKQERWSRLSWQLNELLEDDFLLFPLNCTTTCQNHGSERVWIKKHYRWETKNAWVKKEKLDLRPIIWLHWSCLFFINDFKPVSIIKMLMIL